MQRQHIATAVILTAIALVPLFGEPFYTRLASRILIYGLCALSLDLILGYGGMVSFGHAAFLGVGAYSVGILAHYGVGSAWVAWPAAVLVAGFCALLVGLISLRTSGAYFIMITLAFAQMFYYFFTSLEIYGGDDGMAMVSRNSFGPLLSIEGNTTFFYVVLTILVLVLWTGHRLVRSHFGMVIRGSRENERRMQSIGFSTFRYKLVCFVIAGAIAGLAGALLANQSRYISPALLHWTRSGDIMIMVILGGMGSLTGPILGAIGLLAVEEALSGVTQHWMIIMGPLLIMVVLFARGGIWGVFSQK